MQHVAKILEMKHPKTCSGSPVNQNQSQSTNGQNNSSTSSTTKTTSSHSSGANSQRKCIDVMFSKFASFYGHVWRSLFKHEWFLDFTKKEWADGLSSFNDEVVNKAVIHCRDFCEMPPTLPQIIILCRQIKKRNEFFIATQDHTPTNIAVVNRHLNQCKAFLVKQ